MPIEADVSGVIQLRFVVLGNNVGEIQAIADPQLHEAVSASVPTPTTIPGAASLTFVTDLEILRVEGQCAPDVGGVSIGNQTFDRALVWGSRCTDFEEVYYLIEGQYSTLTAVAGFSNASDLESEATVEVWGDSERIAGPFSLVHGEAVPIEADVSGVIQLRFVVLGNNVGEIQAIADPQLEP